MSRSFKKNPFMAVTGNSSAKKDKVIAHRSVRRTQKRAIYLAEDFEDLVLPLVRECSHNDVWGWVRDGKQRYQDPKKYGDDAWFKTMMRK